MKSTKKMHLRVVGPISELSFGHSKTLRIGSRLVYKIKKVGKKWIESIENNCCMIGYELDLFYVSFLVIRRISFLSHLLHSGLCNTNKIL